MDDTGSVPGRSAVRNTARRAAALSGHLGDRETARRLAADESPEVRATALAALERLGALDDATLEGALRDPAAPVRRRAAQLASRHPAVPLLASLADADATVVEVAAWACGERPASAEVVTTLAAVARAHDDPLCREAAVAALGALGDPDGLPAILAALDDRPAVRRRAVLALAPYEGPEVDAALLAALGDRDRQVRQAAEDLR